MAIAQNRFTYPTCNSKPLFLNLIPSQKYQRHMLSNIIYQGINLNNATINIEIYKFNGKTNSRFMIPNPPRERCDGFSELQTIMRADGFEKVYEDSTPSQFFSVSTQGLQSTFRLDTTLTPFRNPGLFRDVWTITAIDGRVHGPFINTFRLHSNLIQNSLFFPSFLFDLKLFPNELPWQTMNMPISLIVLPAKNHMLNPQSVSVFRTLVSNMYFRIVQILRTRDRLGNNIDPPEPHPAPSTLITDQNMNFFFFEITTSSLPDGDYVFQFESFVDAAITARGSFGIEFPSSLRSYWIPVKISVNSRFPTPIGFPFADLNSVQPFSYLYPTIFDYDSDKNRIYSLFKGTMADLMEPRDENFENPDENTTKQTSSSQQYCEKLAYFDESLSSDLNNDINTSKKISPQIPPQIIVGGTVLQPASPIDGSNLSTQNDFYITGNKIRLTGAPVVGANVRYWSEIKVIKNGMEYESFSENSFLTDGFGNRYVQLKKRPDLAFRELLSYGTYVANGLYAIINPSPPPGTFQPSILRFTPSNFNTYVLNRKWITFRYSYNYDATDPNSTPLSIENGIRYYEADTVDIGFTSSPQIMLGKNINGTYGPFVYHGGSLLTVNVDYSIISEGSGGRNYIVFNFVPSQLIQIWYN